MPDGDKLRRLSTSSSSSSDKSPHRSDIEKPSGSNADVIRTQKSDRARESPDRGGPSTSRPVETSQKRETFPGRGRSDIKGKGKQVDRPDIKGKGKEVYDSGVGKDDAGKGSVRSRLSGSIRDAISSENPRGRSSQKKYVSGLSGLSDSSGSSSSSESSVSRESSASSVRTDYVRSDSVSPGRHQNYTMASDTDSERNQSYSNLPVFSDSPHEQSFKDNSSDSLGSIQGDSGKSRSGSPVNDTSERTEAGASSDDAALRRRRAADAAESRRDAAESKPDETQ